MATKLRNDGERMIPEYHKDNLLYAEHTTRYIAAQPVCKNKIVLDIASGSGYGTKLLSATAKKVYGVEIDPKAVSYAQEHFAAHNVTYLQGSATDIPLDNDSVDVVVTFETIEHIDDYEKFLTEINRVLKPGGLALISTPNDVEFAEGNHFHLHEFKYKELQKLLAKHFLYSKEYFQATWKAVMVGDIEIMRQERVQTVPLYNEAGLSLNKFLYFYFICSNEKIKAHIEPVVALGAHYSDRALLTEAQHNSDVLDERNRVIADRSQELQSVHEHTDQLQAEIDRLRLALQNTTKQLDRIKNSALYRGARTARSVVKRIKGTQKHP